MTNTSRLLRGSIAFALMVSLLGLAACGDPGRARIPTNRYLEQNAPAQSDYQPQNSLPR